MSGDRTLHRVGRRAFLADLGRATFAIALFGPSAVAAPQATAKKPAAARSTTGGAARLRLERVNLGFVSAYVLVRGSEAAIVDTGVAGSDKRIEATLRAVGADWRAVRHVLLTHNHPDHAGSIVKVIERSSRATGYGGAADIASLTTPRRLKAVGDGDEVFGLRIVATPGHTPGHICIFDPGTGLLVAGDALNGSGTDVTGPNPGFTADMATALQSVSKLAALDVRTIVFGHGDPVTAEAKAKLTALAK